MDFHDAAKELEPFLQKAINEARDALKRKVELEEGLEHWLNVEADNRGKTSAIAEHYEREGLFVILMKHIYDPHRASIDMAV